MGYNDFNLNLVFRDPKQAQQDDRYTTPCGVDVPTENMVSLRKHILYLELTIVTTCTPCGADNCFFYNLI